MEWKELYKKWRKKKETPVGELLPPPLEEEKEEKVEGKSELPLSIKVEKIEAKLEVFDNLRKGLEEKISYLSEQIGELRAMMIQREKFYSDVEIAAKRMEGIIETLRSEDVIKQLKTRKIEIEENKARIERMEGLVNAYTETVKKLQNVLERLKPLDVVIEESEKIDEKIRSIDEKRKEIERYLEKVERMYADMREVISTFKLLKSKIENVENAIKDVVKMIDEVRLNYRNLEERIESFQRT